MRYIDRSTVYNRGGLILEPGDCVSVRYVTVVGYDHDFAVYMGNWNQTDLEISKSGDKVSESVGRAVAPYCSHLRYRD